MMPMIIQYDVGVRESVPVSVSPHEFATRMRPVVFVIVVITDCFVVVASVVLLLDQWESFSGPFELISGCPAVWLAIAECLTRCA